jgi:hypothetical protein
VAILVCSLLDWSGFDHFFHDCVQLVLEPCDTDRVALGGRFQSRLGFAAPRKELARRSARLHSVNDRFCLTLRSQGLIELCFERSPSGGERLARAVANQLAPQRTLNNLAGARFHESPFKFLAAGSELFGSELIIAFEFRECFPQSFALMRPAFGGGKPVAEFFALQTRLDSGHDITSQPAGLAASGLNPRFVDLLARGQPAAHPPKLQL